MFIIDVYYRYLLSTLAYRHILSMFINRSLFRSICSAYVCSVILKGRVSQSRVHACRACSSCPLVSRSWLDNDEDNAHPLDGRFATQSKANCNEIEMMTNPKTKRKERNECRCSKSYNLLGIVCDCGHPPVMFHLWIHCDSIYFDCSSSNLMCSLLLIFSIKNISLYMFLFPSLPF